MASFRPPAAPFVAMQITRGRSKQKKRQFPVEGESPKVEKEKKDRGRV